MLRVSSTQVATYATQVNVNLRFFGTGVCVADLSVAAHTCSIISLSPTLMYINKTSSYLVTFSGYSGSDTVGRQVGDLFIGQAQERDTRVMYRRILQERFIRFNIYNLQMTAIPCTMCAAKLTCAFL